LNNSKKGAYYVIVILDRQNIFTIEVYDQSGFAYCLDYRECTQAFRHERKMERYLANAGLKRIKTERITWVDEYDDGSEVFDFFASTTGLWFFHRLPPELRNKAAERMRNYYHREQITCITSDVIIAYGEKK
jgi:hypothetical protein